MDISVSSWGCTNSVHYGPKHVVSLLEYNIFLN